MGVTIKDVANYAGVSVATVSRVVNESGPVSAETRARVLEALEALRYVPDASARSLITSQTHTFGVLLPDLHGEFFTEIIRGIDHATTMHGYHLLVSGSHSDPEEMKTMLRTMAGRVDGLLIMAPVVDTEVIADVVPSDTPVVVLNHATSAHGYDGIVIDNYNGAYAMVEHLIADGHQRIAFISGPEGNYDASERRRGYGAALRDHDIHPPADFEVIGTFRRESGRQAATELCQRSPAPTAIFAANDSMAIGALSALLEAGLEVPGDIAVAGFDDIPLARYMTPSLSTVHVPIYEMGTRATDLLHEQVTQDRGTPHKEVLATTLRLRASCGHSASEAG